MHKCLMHETCSSGKLAIICLHQRLLKSGWNSYHSSRTAGRLLYVIIQDWFRSLDI